MANVDGGNKWLMTTHDSLKEVLEFKTVGASGFGRVVLS